MSKKRIPYFKFYPSDFMHGVRGLSAQEVGIYTMLLCRIYEEDGPVECHIVRLSTYCGMRENTFKQVLDKLIVLGKLTLKNGMISNARSEAEISSRSDDLKNKISGGKASAKKRQQNQQNISTEPQQNLNYTDTDTYKNKELTTLVPKNGKNGTRLPEDWCLSDSLKDWIRLKGFGRDFIMREFEKFKNFWYSKSGKDATKVDWDATFRNWVLIADERKPANKPMTVQQAALFAQAQRKLEIVSDNRMEQQQSLAVTSDRPLSIPINATKQKPS